MKTFFLIFILASFVVLCSVSLHADDKSKGIDPTFFNSTSDYTYSWWTYGLRDDRHVWSLQTSRYGLQFDVPNMKLSHLVRINGIDESAALIQNDEKVFGEPNASLECILRVGGKAYKAIGSSSDFKDSHLIESGRFFQRRTFTNIKWEVGCPALTDSSLEIAAWPDRLAFILRITPEAELKDAEIELSLESINPFLSPQKQKETFSVTGKLTGHSGTVFHTALWKAGEEHSQILSSIRDQNEYYKPTVTAVQIAPKETPLEVKLDEMMGWFEIKLRNDVTGEPPYNDRIERVRLSIYNPTESPQVVHLNFSKKDVFGITGISVMLRDMDGNPTGIPIQISKNWHGNPDRYNGPWYRGLAMVTVPAKKKVELEYTSVNALWGGVAAASHAQLCLVGWGINQLWEQAAIGSWGESICFEPDQSHGCSTVTDTRPLMVFENPGEKWGWTGNVGGANFLEYYDPKGYIQWNSVMKTDFKRYCPVLTEVSHSGKTHDGKIDLEYTVSLYRTDDINRGIYHFRYDVRKPTDFSRLVLFQCGADRYSCSSEKKLAMGNENGLVNEWDAQWDGSTYKTAPMEVTGRVPWFSMHDTFRQKMNGSSNKGFVIRYWNAKLGGKKVNPWAAERGTNVFNIPSSIIDILLPPDVKMLKPGDYVECVVEHIVMPQFAKDYYGPNKNLKSALKKDQNTWKMLYREALGNDLAIDVTKGKLIRNRPTLVLAKNNTAEFSITGGLGYTPVTISGLKGYRDPMLEMKDGNKWVKIDQSVYGKDFWQTDYNAVTKTWEITYSIPMDTPSDQRIKRTFRFRIAD